MLRSEVSPAACLFQPMSDASWMLDVQGATLCGVAEMRTGEMKPIPKVQIVNAVAFLVKAADTVKQGSGHGNVPGVHVLPPIGIRLGYPMIPDREMTIVAVFITSAVRRVLVGDAQFPIGAADDLVIRLVMSRQMVLEAVGGQNAVRIYERKDFARRRPRAEVSKPTRAVARKSRRSPVAKYSDPETEAFAELPHLPGRGLSRQEQLE
jgi:hypothetical protein